MDNLSKREEINEFIVNRNLENIKEVEGHYIYIEENSNTNFSFSLHCFCKIRLYERNKFIYAHTTNIKDYIDIFSEDVSLDNFIDQNLKIKLKNEIKFKVNENEIEFYREIKPHRYNEERIRTKTIGKLSYYNSIDRALMRRYSVDKNTITEDKLIDMEDLINNRIDYKNQTKIKARISSKLNPRKKELLHSKSINAHIEKVEVKDNENIIMTIKADNITHSKNLEYTFREPMNENSKFLEFIDYMDVNSVDELELLPVQLLQDSEVNKLYVDGWSVCKREKEPDTYINRITSFLLNLI